MYILLQHTTAPHHCTTPLQHRKVIDTHDIDRHSRILYCNTPLQHTTATHHCNTAKLLIHTTLVGTHVYSTAPTATHCTTMQHAATRCNTLQHTTLVDNLHSTAPTATHQCNTPLHHTTAPHHCYTAKSWIHTTLMYSLLHLECHSNLNIQFQSHRYLFNGTWQKRPRERDHRVRFAVPHSM